MQFNKTTTLRIAVVLGAVAVGVGAFGAHALKPMLEASGRANTFELAVRYQFYHTLALLGTGLWMNFNASNRLQYAALCFFLGVIFFCGSLYVLCFTGLGILGAVTPIGGVFFIGGWVFLLLASFPSTEKY
jgi:uncharacterized membrane protein YgdD (TMEM256/DUF423 family)